MASIGQDFTKFEEDTFEIKFVVTDATVDLSSYEAYWAANLTPTSSGEPLVQKSTAGWTSGVANIGGITTTGTDTFLVSITQSDFVNGPLNHGTLRTGSFYHELTIGSSDNGSDSVVVATGTMTINPAIFTEENYRS